MKYIAKPDTWFKEGTEVTLEEDLSCGTYTTGIFKGIYVIGNSGYDNFWYENGYKEGDEVVMRELCRFDEFYTV